MFRVEGVAPGMHWIVDSYSTEAEAVARLAEIGKAEGFEPYDDGKRLRVYHHKANFYGLTVVEVNE